MKVEAVVKKRECLKVAWPCSASKKKKKRQREIILNMSIKIIQHIFNLKVNRSHFYSGYSSGGKCESKHLKDGFEY